MRCGLLGRNLGHSYSPLIHSMLGDYSYTLFEKEPQELGVFLMNGDFDAINVTIPYKKDVIPYLDSLSTAARELGAVNTIVRRNGKLIGHNTDYFGFETMLRFTNLSFSGKKVLVLGSGGASNTAVAVLRSQGANVIVISRTGENNYQNIARHKDAAVIVNTTPVGMYPDTDFAPINIYDFPNLEGVLDVIYNPARTMLLRMAQEQGLATANGLLMLVAQAKEASEWFQNQPIDDDVIPKIHHILQQKMENIVLIGMPGCGKSTVGKSLAEAAGKRFADADLLVEQMAGKTIPEIFAQEGEEVFRNWETKALAALGKESGLVIATGGGCVTRSVNRSLLQQNGTIYWLCRDLDRLPTDGRPLSQANPISSLYAARRPLYEAFADHIIDNNGDVQVTVNTILEKEKRS